jgi:hypothetical protein
MDLDPSSLNINSRVQLPASTTQNLNTPHGCNDEVKSGGLECPLPPPAVLVVGVSGAEPKMTELDPALKDTKASPLNIEGTPVDDDPRLWSAGKKVSYSVHSKLTSDPDIR